MNTEEIYNVDIFSHFLAYFLNSSINFNNESCYLRQYSVRLRTCGHFEILNDILSHWEPWFISIRKKCPLLVEFKQDLVICKDFFLLFYFIHIQFTWVLFGPMNMKFQLNNHIIMKHDIKKSIVFLQTIIFFLQ